MGLTPSPLVRALFLFSLMNPLVVLQTPLVVLMNPLVVSVAWVLAFFVPTVIDSIGDTVPLVTFVPKGVDSKGGQIIEVFWRPKS